MKDPNLLDVTLFTNLTPTEKIEEINNFKEQNKFPEISNNKNNKKLCEILISYKPYDSLDYLEISSDFTGWKKIKMEKVKKNKKDLLIKNIILYYIIFSFLLFY